MASRWVVKQKHWGDWAARITVALVVAVASLAFGGITNRAEARPVQASIVADAVTGEVISASNADALTYPASLTKMMTLYLLFEAMQDGRVKLTDTIQFSKYAAGQPATNLNVRGGDTISVETAILALVIRSANDAATAVAEHLGGTEAGFAKLMTAKARDLGMSHTTFRNANGLPDPKQKSTARDLATLSIALLRDFPQYYDYFSRTKFKYRGVTYNGHNRLLKSFKGYDGIKTGYIRASGFNLASSAQRDGRRLVVVVLGGSSPSARDRKVADLLTDGFKRTGGTGMMLAAKAPRSAGTQIAAQPAQPAVVAKPAQPIVAPKDQVAMDQIVAQALQTQTAKSQPLNGLEPQPKPFKPAAAPAQPAGIIEADFDLDSADATLTSSAPGLAPLLKPGTRNDLEVAAVAKPDTQSTTVVWKAEGDYGIQVGAYSRYNAAQNAAQVAAKAEPALLADARIIIDSQKMNNGGKVYRARVAGLTKADAQTACKNLKAKRTDCLVLKLDNALAAAGN